jgi:protein-disulfide isomerase
MKRYFPLAIIAVVLIAGIAAGVVLLRRKQAVTTAPFIPPAAITPAVTPTSPAASATITPKSKAGALPSLVSVTIEEYGDYQCPPCGLLHPEMKSIESDYGTRIRFNFRNLPLTKIHKNALLAAQAAEAARLQDRFEQMHNRLYESQNEWKDEANPRPTFIRYAGELGLNTDQFDRDMDGPQVKQRLADDQQRAESIGVQGTPTVFIEGKELKPELTNGEGIRKGIDFMLKQKAGGD